MKHKIEIGKIHRLVQGPKCTVLYYCAFATCCYRDGGLDFDGWVLGVSE